MSASFLGLLASAPVWNNSHSFPPLPIATWFPALPPPADKIRFVLMLIALVTALRFYRSAVAFFLVCILWAFLEDQNRGQPWMYMYWVLLLLTLFPDATALAACRCALSASYIWSGIQKCNARFFEVTPSWFIAPAEHWQVPHGLLRLLQLGVASAPFFELAIGLALWMPFLRTPAIAAAAVLHLAALLFLGPLGHNYNWVVWPWNLVMILLVYCLFAGKIPWEKFQTSRESLKPRDQNVPSKMQKGLLRNTFVQLKTSKAALLVVALFSFLPVLSYRGWWDSYFSFSLYSENAAVANVFVTENFRDRLPASLRSYVQKFPMEYDPIHQGPLTFSFQVWGFEQLHVPPISEPRNFRSVFAFLRTYAKDPGDLRMIVGQRGGPVLFFQGDQVEFLTPKP